MPSAKEFRLGILLVHGIGRPRSGETLVRWGDVFLETLRSATRPPLEVILERAGPGPDASGQERAEAVWRLRAGEHVERWLLCEGWWAEAFSPPSYRELVSWSVRALPWSFGIHFAHQFWEAGRKESPRARTFAKVVTVVQLLAALVIAPVFVAVLTVMLVVGLLPIPQLREILRAAQGALTGTVGDSLAFVESPTRAALIRTRIVDALEGLRRSCERTVVVAHSQGAAVVLDALGGILQTEAGAGGARRAQVAPAESPDVLLTFGSGVNQLASLKARSSGLPGRLGRDPIALAIGCLALAFGTVVWYLAEVAAGRATFRAGLLAGGAVFAFLGILVLVTSAAILMGRRVTGRPGSSPRAKNVFAIVFSVLLVAGIFAFTLFSDHAELPIGVVYMLLMSILGIAGGVRILLSQDMQATLETKRKPPGLPHWVDVYASADPVPNGPTRTPEHNVPDTRRTWNLGSAVADHTTYWDDLDGFVLTVARTCVHTAKCPWAGSLPPERAWAARRSGWRVRWLQLARWTLAPLWVWVAIDLWPQARSASLPAWVPDWLVGSVGRPFLFGVVVAAAWWASNALVRWIWRMWVRYEQRAVLAHTSPGGAAVFALTGMGMVWWGVFRLGHMLRSKGDLSALFVDPFEAVAPVAGLALLSALVLYWWRPPPKPPPEETADANAKTG